MSVTSLLSGALTDTTATVVAEVGASVSCRLAYSSSDPALAAPTYTAAVTADANGYARLPVTGLVQDTTYHYGIETAGTLDAARGKLKTHPVAAGSPASFTIAHASCTSYYDAAPSNHRVYDAITARAPLAFHMLGDLHYGDIATANSPLMRSKIHDTISTARAAAMFAAVPFTYVWDDHDFGPDNSDGTFVGKTNVAAVYRQAIPHHTLPDTGAVYQAWIVGRVRFIQTDLRYYRTPNGATDDAAKTMMGATQKAWFKAELLAAKDNLLTVWLNSQVWSVDTFTGQDADRDHWGAYSTERAEINDYMATNGITNVIQLTGDQHALAIRRHVDYSTAQTAPMRIYSAAALDSLPVTRAGGWDQVQAGKGQYGTLDVSDFGTGVKVDWNGWAVNPTTGAETLVMSDSFTVGDVPEVRPVKVWDGVEWTPRPVKVWDGSTWTVRPVTA